MATIAMPSAPGFSSVRWGLLSNTQVFESPLTRSVQRIRLTGERWVGEFKLPPIKQRAVAAEWEAFFALLEGRANDFRVGPPRRSTPRQGLPGGTPLVKGASQTGSSLITDGWPNSTQVLRKGDYVQLGTDQLVMVTADASSDGSGGSTLSIKPALRSSPADDSALTIASPTCRMILTTDEVGWDVDKLNLFTFQFTGVEVFA